MCHVELGWKLDNMASVWHVELGGVKLDCKGSGIPRLAGDSLDSGSGRRTGLIQAGEAGLDVEMERWCNREASMCQVR